MLTVDHGLRPESGAEAAFVADAAAALGLEHIVLVWDGAKPESGLQAAAREARYDLMSTAARASGMDCLASAHHLDDQGETLLMRLKRGSGVDGLGAMAAESFWAGVPVIRPLLDIPSLQLRRWLEREGVAWIEDPSNADERFERVRLRRALATLESLGYSAGQLAATARRMRRAGAALEYGARSFLADHAQMHEAGYCEIGLEAFRALPEELSIRALRMTLEAVSGGARASSLSRLERLDARLRGESWRAHTLSGCRIMRRGDVMLIAREAGRRGLGELRLAPGGSAVWDRRIAVSAAAALPQAVTVRALGREGMSAVRAQAKSAPLHIPAAAAQTVASFWCGDELVSVPQLGFHAPALVGRAGAAEGALCQAQLLCGDTFPRPRPR
ncbi:MAG: hypothetical protein Kow0032_19160 [Methyloligellaceae bacterium]